MADDEPDKADLPEKSDDRVVTLDEVTMDKGTIDFHDHDGVISGNVYRGAVLRGDCNISVEGEIAGVPETRSVIEVKGDVQVEQSATGAKITACNVVIAGDTSGCQILAEGYLELHGNLSSSQINLGSRTGAIKALNHKRLEAKTVDQKISELTVQTSSAARKFVRDYPQVDLKMGNILVPLKRELRVRLQQFYNAVGTTETDKVDKALEEFYLRVVVGMLTRNNKAYISRNPSRHKIFLKLIEELRLHVLKIRALDKYQEQKTKLLKESGELLRQLQDPDKEPNLRVGGTIGEDVTVVVTRLKGFQENSMGTFDIERSVMEARFVHPEDGEGLVIDVTGPGGVKNTITPPEGGFTNGTLMAWEDDLIWKPV